MFGFGYNDSTDSTDTYKVVANIIDRQEWRNELRVYDMGDTWRTVSTSPDLLLSWEEPQFVGNSFNLLAVKPSGPIDRKHIRRLEYTYDDYVIFSLDVGEKAQKLLRMPPDLDEYNCQEPKVVVLKEHLCIICDFEGTHFVVWQMEEFGVEDSWTTLMYVSYLSLQIDTCKCSFWNYSNFNMSEDEYQEHHTLSFSSKSHVLKQPSSKPHLYDPPLTFTSLSHQSQSAGMNTPKLSTGLVRIERFSNRG
ncbi:hypothetical protein PIB30_024240 [Stylosanthes scabra]|uniref:F-box associated domain-containing protein n=1 Tax=Stylosanthes scabra TaxID=79078 RepID=A0ABU6TAI4_9FABA|nr:hypothetical protein [Stylosanthes scabra]